MRSARYHRALRHKVTPALLAMLAAAATLTVGCRHRSLPPPPSSVVVTGVVTRAAGGPLPGASIILTVDPDDGHVPIATTKTNAIGVFRIERVPPGRYRLRARATGFVEGLARIDLTATPSATKGAGDRRFDVKLLPAMTLAGRVQDGRGVAIPFARVLAFAVADAGKSSVINEARANQEGGFKLDGLTAGAHRLLIEAPGLGTASAGPVQVPDETVVVVLPGEIRTILGLVTREGRAVGGAHVLLGGEAMPESRAADADDQGRFAFAGLGPGTYALRAEAGGWVSPVVKQLVRERAPALAAAPAPPLELTLAPGTYAKGKVVGDTGAPVAGATVLIDQVPAIGLWSSRSTDADGSWNSPPLGPGTYRVRARQDGFVARRTVTVQVPKQLAGSTGVPLPPAPITLELMRTGRIVGRVVNERGAAVAGATVHDRLADSEELGVIWARLPLAAEAAALPSGSTLPSTSSRAPARRTISDAAGNFLLKDVPPGRVQVEILNSSSVPLRTKAVILAPGTVLDVGTLRMQGAVQVAGRVVDWQGRPVTGARVAAASTTRGPPEPATGLYALTAADGTFSLPLPAGEHRLTASAPGHQEVTSTVRVNGATGTVDPTGATTLRLGSGDPGATAADAPPGTTAEISGGPSTTILEGAVFDAEGRPLSHARIAVRRAGAGAGASRAGAAATVAVPLRTGLTDSGGAFRLSGLPAAHVVLDIQHAGYAPHLQPLDLGSDARAGGGGTTKTVRVVLPLPGGIDGEVHERITGAPVPKFQIDAHGPGGARARFPDTPTGRRRSSPTDPSGGAAGAAARSSDGPWQFSLRRLTPGRWTLRVQANGYRPIEHTVEVASATSPGTASVRDLRLELERS